MITIPRISGAGQIAVAAFGLLSMLGGWMIVFMGGFTTDATGSPVVVAGPAAAFMAALQLLGAWLALAAVLAQHLSRERWAYALALGLLAAPLPVYVAVLSFA
jgi:NaMN:DMB phosphoribosyltransferase